MSFAKTLTITEIVQFHHKPGAMDELITLPLDSAILDIPAAAKAASENQRALVHEDGKLWLAHELGYEKDTLIALCVEEAGTPDEHTVWLYKNLQVWPKREIAACIEGENVKITLKGVDAVVRLEGAAVRSVLSQTDHGNRKAASHDVSSVIQEGGVVTIGEHPVTEGRKWAVTVKTESVFAALRELPVFTLDHVSAYKKVAVFGEFANRFAAALKKYNQDTVVEVFDHRQKIEGFALKINASDADKAKASVTDAAHEFVVGW